MPDTRRRRPGPRLRRRPTSLRAQLREVDRWVYAVATAVLKQQLAPKTNACAPARWEELHVN